MKYLCFLITIFFLPLLHARAQDAVYFDSAAIREVHRSIIPVQFYNEKINKINEISSCRGGGEYNFKFYLFKADTTNKTVRIIGNYKPYYASYSKAFLGRVEGDSLSIRKTFEVSKYGSFDIETDVKEGEMLAFYDHSKNKDGNGFILTPLHRFYLSKLFKQ